MTVNSQDELIKLVQTLAADFKADPSKWENTTVDTYLEALTGWAEDIDGCYADRGEPTPTTPAWGTLVDMLIAATMYE